MAQLARSGHIHVALALGASIILFAIVSKRVLSEPIKPLYMSIPSLLMIMFELIANSDEHRHLANSKYWVAAILIATAAIIGWHLL